MVEPTMIQDDFMGDFYLGCPNCKEIIIFPMCKNPEKHKPTHCRKCGETFDWSKYENKIE